MKKGSAKKGPAMQPVMHKEEMIAMGHKPVRKPKPPASRKPKAY